MRSCAFLFPGQGSQYVGMGRELVRHFGGARQLLARAEALLDMTLGNIMDSGPDERLNEDFTAQVTVYVVSCMVVDILARRGVRPALVAPYSSGIYSAVYAAGVLDFETCLSLMRDADRCIHEAQSGGAMGAVLGLSATEVEELCSQVPGVAEVSIINTRHQIIVSGEPQAVGHLLRLATESGALKSDWLPGRAAYHCSLLRGADECLVKRISRLPLKTPHTPIVSYLDSQIIDSASKVAQLLSVQLRSLVNWVDVVDELGRRQIAPLVEVGPGQMLSRSVRWIHRRAEVLSTNSMAELEEVIKRIA